MTENIMSVRLDSTHGIPVAGRDFQENTDTFVIYNVPIVVAMVQRYEDGMHLKPLDEVKNIRVDNVPIVMRDDEPSHPKFVDQMTTDEFAKLTVGHLREQAKPKIGASPLKRYADFVFYNTPRVRHIINTYKSGGRIDTSIGFRYVEDATPGEWNGIKYDMVERQITLDHNAILYTPSGQMGIGRAPSAISGIGADSTQTLEAQAEDEKGETMGKDENLQEKVDALEQQNVELTKELDALKAQDSDKLKEAHDALKLDFEKVKKELKSASDELEGFRAQRKEQVDAMRSFVAEQYPDMKDMVDAADENVIESHYKALKEKSDKADKSDIGAAMAGTDANKAAVEKSAADKTAVWIENLNKKGDKQ